MDIGVSVGNFPQEDPLTASLDCVSEGNGFSRNEMIRPLLLTSTMPHFLVSGKKSHHSDVAEILSVGLVILWDPKK